MRTSGDDGVVVGWRRHLDAADEWPLCCNALNARSNDATLEWLRPDAMACHTSVYKYALSSRVDTNSCRSAYEIIRSV